MDLFFCLSFAMPLCASVYMCLVVTCWERADLLALACGFELGVCHFPIGILGPVWYLIVWIPDLCTLTYFSMVSYQYKTGRVYDLCVYFMAGTPEGSTESDFMKKPGIKPTTPGLQDIGLSPTIWRLHFGSLGYGEQGKDPRDFENNKSIKKRIFISLDS